LPSNCDAEGVVPGHFAIENQANPFARCFGFHRDWRGGLKSVRLCKTNRQARVMKINANYSSQPKTRKACWHQHATEREQNLRKTRGQAAGAHCGDKQRLLCDHTEPALKLIRSDAVTSGICNA
jgi:hypothetical protein